MAKIFTNDQESFVRTYIPGHSYREISDEVFKRFGIKLTNAQVKSWIGNRKLSTGLSGHFSKGHVPANKGKHQKITGRMAETMFKKGHVPANKDKTGTEKVKGDGYVWIKIAEPNVWKQKHRIIYEQVHGKISDKDRIIFADGNNRNFDIDNLIKVNNVELLRMNLKGNISEFPEVTKSNLIVTKLDIAISKKQK